MTDLLEYLREAWEHRDDSYWHADHPEVRAVLIAVFTGLVGLAFAWLEILIHRRYQLPNTRDV